MPFTHHSHSGQFCKHAKDQLEETIQTAIRLSMHTFCLTEHMAREQLDLYPEELEENVTEESLAGTVAAYFKEAQRLREKYSSQISIVIGFESEWIRPSSLSLINKALAEYPVEYFLGSIHHTLSIPIDFDRPMYEAAKTKAGGTDEALFAAYFDEQYDLLKTLRPPVVGHFDLIRLYSEQPNASMKRFTGVWEKVMRNLEFIASYGGVMELNFASLRKGMTEPYPKADICQEFLAMNGRFCLSDDSHGVSQVGLNYHHVLPYLESTGIQEIYYLEHLPAEKRRSASTEGDSVFDERFPSTALRRMDMGTLKAQPFWTKVAGK